MHLSRKGAIVQLNGVKDGARGQVFNVYKACIQGVPVRSFGAFLIFDNLVSGKRLIAERYG